MSGAPRANACAASVRRRPRVYCMTDRFVIWPNACARWYLVTPHAVAISSNVRSRLWFRSMTKRAFLVTDMAWLRGGLADGDSRARVVVPLDRGCGGRGAAVGD